MSSAMAAGAAEAGVRIVAKQEGNIGMASTLAGPTGEHEIMRQGTMG